MTLQFSKYIAFCHIAWQQFYCPLLCNHNLTLKLYQIKKTMLMTDEMYNYIMKFIIPILCVLNKRVCKSSRSF